jgi:small subunit ribosomal protein S7e
MFTSKTKIKKARNADPSPLEEQVALALYELQCNSDKLKAPLREVHITAAKEVDVGGGKLAIVIFVPVPHLAQFQKIIKERSLIEELQKKFSGQPIVIIAERRIIRREGRNTRQLKQLRPRTRTLTVVHESILEDLVFPSQIVGKRTRVRGDGSKLIKVYLDPEPHTGDRIETFGKVYKNLTGKDAVFDFPSAVALK